MEEKSSQGVIVFEKITGTFWRRNMSPKTGI
jgi:hypothetical protein